MTTASTPAKPHRIFSTSVASVYPLYLAKIEKKGRSKSELDAVLRWLTGFEDATLAKHLEEGTTFAEFFEQATLNPAASKITGLVCGVRVEAVDDALLRKIRLLDKLVDELAKGRALETVLRT